MRGAQEARTPLRREHQEGMIQLSSSGGVAVDKLGVGTYVWAKPCSHTVVTVCRYGDFQCGKHLWDRKKMG